MEEPTGKCQADAAENNGGGDGNDSNAELTDRKTVAPPVVDLDRRDKVATCSVETIASSSVSIPRTGNLRNRSAVLGSYGN